MTALHELLQDTVAQDRNVTFAIDVRSPCIFRGKRFLQRRFLHDVIADHRVEAVEVANLAKVDLLQCSHALRKCGLFEIVEMNMTNRKAAALAVINDFVAEETATKETAPKKSRNDIMRDIEDKHLGRCIDQMWGNGRRDLLELMEVRGTHRNCIVLKQFEERVSTSSSKPWPDLAGVYVFVPIEDGDNTWKGLDEKLAEFREKHKVQD